MKRQDLPGIACALFILVIVLLCRMLSAVVAELQETRKQRDEAYELARKAQNSAMYWYDVHEKMVWHYPQPNE